MKHYQVVFLIYIFNILQITILPVKTSLQLTICTSQDTTSSNNRLGTVKRRRAKHECLYGYRWVLHAFGTRIHIKTTLILNRDQQNLDYFFNEFEYIDNTILRWTTFVDNSLKCVVQIRFITASQLYIGMYINHLYAPHMYIQTILTNLYTLVLLTTNNKLNFAIYLAVVYFPAINVRGSL